MSLTGGTSPFGPNPAGVFAPDGAAYIEPYLRRVRGELDGRTVVDSDRVLMVHPQGQSPVYAFPAEDVDGAPAHAQRHAPGHVSIEWSDLDAWFEEDEQIRGWHPRNPYHRVDWLPSSRRLRVTVAGTFLVDTSDTVAVFETSLAPRLYVAPDHVRTDLLRPSPTTTFCAYKGTAHYWTAVVGDVILDDVAWSYEETFPESAPLEGLLSFDAVRAEVTADLPAPRTWRPE